METHGRVETILQRKISKVTTLWVIKESVSFISPNKSAKRSNDRNTNPLEPEYQLPGQREIEERLRHWRILIRIETKWLTSLTTFYTTTSNNHKGCRISLLLRPTLKHQGAMCQLTRRKVITPETRRWGTSRCQWAHLNPICMTRWMIGQATWWRDKWTYD